MVRYRTKMLLLYSHIRNGSSSVTNSFSFVLKTNRISLSFSLRGSPRERFTKKPENPHKQTSATRFTNLMSASESGRVREEFFLTSHGRSGICQSMGDWPTSTSAWLMAEKGRLPKNFAADKGDG